MHPIIKKRLILLAIATASLLAVIFFLNNSLLTISSGSDEEKVVFIGNSGSTKNFTLKKGSKTLLLPRGTYQIEISNTDKTTYYQKTLGIFWKHTVNAELKQQKSSTFLGESDLRCSKDQAKVVIFYSCSPGNFGVIRNSQASVEAEEHKDDITDFSSVLKPYNDTFVEARSENGSLKIINKSNSGAPLGSGLTQKFESKVSESTFTVSHNGELAALDGNNKTVLRFKNLQDQNPSKTTVEDVEVEEQDYGISVYATESYTFMLNAPTGDHTDGDGAHSDEPPKTNPKIIAIDHANSGKITEQALPADWVVYRTKAGHDDSVTMLLSGAQQGQVYRYSPKDGLKKLNAVKDTIESLCWVDTDTFYYRADASKSIFEYSTEKNASFLVYSSDTNFIEEISCIGNRLYFAISSDKSENPNNLSHYLLTDQHFFGTRLNTILPMYHTFSQDTLRFSESRGGITISLDYDSAGNGPPPKELARQELLRLLSDKGVETNNLQINFAY